MKNNKSILSAATTVGLMLTTAMPASAFPNMAPTPPAYTYMLPVATNVYAAPAPTYAYTPPVTNNVYTPPAPNNVYMPPVPANIYTINLEKIRGLFDKSVPSELRLYKCMPSAYGQGARQVNVTKYDRDAALEAIAAKDTATLNAIYKRSIGGYTLFGSECSGEPPVFTRARSCSNGTTNVDDPSKQICVQV